MVSSFLPPCTAPFRSPKPLKVSSAMRGNAPPTCHPERSEGTRINLEQRPKPSNPPCHPERSERQNSSFWVDVGEMSLDHINPKATVQHPRNMLQLMVERSSLCAVPVQPPESCELFFSGTRRTVGTAPPTERRAGRAPHLSAV